MRTLLAFLISCTLALAANKYVRPGASGTQSGDDWTNAYTNVPAALTRGTVYYLADGTYPGNFRWNTANSGTQYIEFRKATAGDHGTETGWSSTYGDGQATVTGYWEFSQDYWKINGVSRSSWTNGHGIKFLNTNTSNDILSFGSNYYSQSSKHVDVRYVEIEGTHSSDDTYDDRLFLVRSLTPVGDDDADDIYLGYSYIHHAGAVLVMAVAATNFVCEYNWIEYNDSSPAVHSEGIVLNSGCQNFTFRYNYLWDAEGTAFIATPTAGHPQCAGPKSSNWYIYGNLFGYTQANGSRPTTGATDAQRTGAGNGLIFAFDTNVTGDFFVYNNTIANLNSSSGWGTISVYIGVEAGSCADRLYVKNNLFWNCYRVDAYTDTATVPTISWTHNAYISCTTVNDSDGNKQTGSTNPFTNSGSDDYTLAMATTAGTTLSSPFDVDIFGATRGGDGTWDRGFDEYGSGGGGSSSGSGKSKPGQGKGRRR
jgi:hypothetical protein